jgi:hypothetical protein
MGHSAMFQYMDTLIRGFSSFHSLTLSKLPCVEDPLRSKQNIRDISQYSGKENKILKLPKGS